ncbi:Plant viral-response family protein-like [Rhynchospora pubera]|uniref:Plant viral-response family protein-like n=1 Tax=Rhynchospora pubera TaxID=906938 RepID=A0AAV8CHJ8_9POAL|nr:Plant viral-response family protein-like [Rhynchospora pubera]
MIGHAGPGIGFLLIGLWHLYNHIKLYSLRPKTYVAPPWFPNRKLRYLELILIIGGSLLSIAAELFIGPEKHQPFDSDGTIPSNHLHNFEHAAISFTFLVYASFAVYFDRMKMKMGDSMTQILAGIAFAQQYLLFHLHSADHMGIEGQYHWLLQLVIVVSLATTLIGIAISAKELPNQLCAVS